jgi:hypothetical protein
VAVAVGAASLAVPAGAGAAVTCTLTGSTLDVDMSAAMDFPQFSIGPGNAITLSGAGTSGCTGSPTTANTDLIEVDAPGAGQGNQMSITRPPGGFGPGLTPEAPGASEIEFDVDLGDGFDSISLVSATEPSADHFRFGALAGGATGANLNAPESGGPDGDDLKLTSVESMSVFAGFVEADSDIVDGSGGPEFTGPNTGTYMNSAGGPGDDTIVGGDAGNTIDGNEGTDLVVSGVGIDTLRGNAGTDTLSYARANAGAVVDLRDSTFQPGTGDTLDDTSFENLIGSGFGDNVTGTTAANTIEGRGGNDVIRGLAGADTLRGEAGDDTLHANDNDADTVLDCGAGAGDVLNRDPATLDPNGIVSGCETMNPAITSAPVLSGFDPASGSDANAPRVKGSAPGGSTVDLFASGDCTGIPVADDVAGALLAADGITVNVPDNSTTAFSAVATTSAGGASPCSNSISYAEVTPATGGGGDGGGDSGGGGPEDRDPPDTRIRKVKVKGDDVKVRFRSDEPGASFECRLDKKPFKPCTSPKRYRNLDDGKHKVFVLATDAAGNTDDKAAKAKFEIG